MNHAKTLLCEALDADTIGLKELALNTYLEASLALLNEPKIALDQLLFEDNFELKNEIVDETRKSLELVERCIKRSEELFSLIQENENVIDNNTLRRSSSSASQNSTTTPGNSPLRKMSVKKKRDMAADLSHVRKQFEKASLAEIIARQKKQSETPLVSSDPHSQTSTKSAGFTINLQVISDLLVQRQDAIGHFNEKLFSLFDLKSKDLSSRKSGGDDELWRKTLRISISSLNGDFMQPIGPIFGLLSHPSHPIAQISRDFVLRFKQLTLENNTNQICEEYHQFSFQMIKLLRHNYAEELADDSLVLALQISIEHFMFSHLPGLGAVIHEAFARVNLKEDADFLQKVNQLSWLTFEQGEEALWMALHVPEKYRLLTLKYEPAVNELRYAASLKCPSIKSTSLVKVCDLICAAIEESSPSASAIGSEDLVLLLAWVIIQAQIPNMHTFFAIMSEFLPEELIRGQAGYVLATLQTCIDYIKSK